MSRQPPGIKYPTLAPAVDQSVHKMARNVFDNLFHLKDRVDKIETAGAAVKAASGSGAAPSAGAMTSGRYTPVLSNVLNLDSSAAFECQYMQVGSVVTVSGRVDIDPTAPGTTQLSISLPVPSNFVKAEDCAGAAACPSIAGQSASIQGSAGTNHALMQWVAVDITLQSMFFTFTYSVL